MLKVFDVLVVGELNVDLVLNQLNSFPQKGKEILANNMLLTLGSSSAIFASNLSVLGTKVCFVGKIGADQFGDLVLKTLQDKGVDTRYVIVSHNVSTGITVALSYENERAMVTYQGAMADLDESEISDEILQSSRHLHVSSIFLQPSLKMGLKNLFQRAKKAGMTTSLDTQWDPEEKWDYDWNSLLPLVDLFMPNVEELKNITGQDSIESCIDKIKDISNTIIIKRGIEGSVAWDKGRIINQLPFLNTEVKDTIGAGDSFNAGFIHKFIRKKPLKECMEFGALCGAINTTAYGGTTAFTTKKEIQKIALNLFKYSCDDL
ncbi:MAG: carbohydrate kinase family protein [Acidobacterium ailaaui]|nr:carbohydrate kinase family protein [Pseudacidobacterium ailaaui]